MSLNPPAIECAGIDKKFDDLKVLDGLNWRVGAGERIALVGRNGAGKSTLLRCLVGLERADAGVARLLGCPSLQLDDETKARIAYVPQLQFGFPELTAQQFLGLIGAFYPRWDRALANRLLDSWDVPRKRMLAGLSLGQLQKLAIIRALATHPEVLLLDEPASALDPVIRRQFVEEVTALAIEDGSTILFTTHILRDVDSVLTRIAAMVGGRIVLDAAVSELRDFHVEAVAETAVPAPASTAPAGVKAWRIDRSGRMRLCYDRREIDADAVAHWVGTPLQPRPFDLESMVVEWTS